MKADLGAAVSGGADRDVGADEQSPFAHPAQAVGLPLDVRWQADAVVADDEHHAATVAVAVAVAAQRDLDPGGAGVAHDVGDAFLRHAVDDELLLGGQRQIAFEVAGDLDPGAIGDRRAQRQQRALQPELVERFGAQPLGDHPHVLRAPARRLAKLLEIAAQLRGCPARERLAAQHQSGEDLSDLVMQLARDPSALALLGGERSARTLTALALETVEHPVERLRQGGDLPARRIDLEALPGRERIDALHHGGQVLQRLERPSQQHMKESEHHHETGEQHHQLRQGHRHRDRHRREDQRQHRERQHRGVADEQAPVERRPGRNPSVAMRFDRHVSIVPHRRAQTSMSWRSA